MEAELSGKIDQLRQAPSSAALAHLRAQIAERLAAIGALAVAQADAAAAVVRQHPVAVATLLTVLFPVCVCADVRNTRRDYLLLLGCAEPRCFPAGTLALPCLLYMTLLSITFAAPAHRSQRAPDALRRWFARVTTRPSRRYQVGLVPRWRGPGWGDGVWILGVCGVC